MPNRTHLHLAVALFAVAAAAACPADKPSATVPATPDAPVATAPAAPDAAAADEAKQIFSTRCTPCHGAGGAGDGPGSTALDPKPANFTSAEWQAKVTDEHIEKILVYGGAAVGKSPAMPSNPDLDGKPVVPALRALIRGLKK